MVWAKPNIIDDIGVVGFHSSVTNNLSGGGYQVAISIDSVEGLSWGSINVEGETLPLEMRKNMYN